MLRKAVIPVMILLLFLGTFSTFTLADDPSSALRSLTYKLQSMLFVVESVDMRLNAVLVDQNTSPVDGNRPLPAPEGLAGMFEAMAIQLQVVGRSVVRTMDSLEADGFSAPLPEEVEEALVIIRDAAHGIFERATLGSSSFPDDIRVSEALLNVADSAFNIFITVSGYLGTTPIDLPE